MSAFAISFSLGLFILAGLCEIAGGWMVWQWLRESRPWSWGLLGAVVLGSLRCNPDFPISPFRSRLCRIRWVLYRLVSSLGLGRGWKQTRLVRFAWRRRDFAWRRYYHVLAKVTFCAGFARNDFARQGATMQMNTDVLTYAGAVRPVRVHARPGRGSKRSSPCRRTAA